MKTPSEGRCLPKPYEVDIFELPKGDEKRTSEQKGMVQTKTRSTKKKRRRKKKKSAIKDPFAN